MEQYKSFIRRGNDFETVYENITNYAMENFPSVNLKVIHYSCFYIKRNDHDYDVTYDDMVSELFDDDFFDDARPCSGSTFEIAHINSEFAKEPSDTDSHVLETAVVDFLVTFNIDGRNFYASFHIEENQNSAMRTIFMNSNIFGKLGARFNHEDYKYHDYFPATIPKENMLFLSNKKRLDLIIDVLGAVECVSQGVDVWNGFSFANCVRNVKRNRIVFDEENIPKNKHLTEDGYPVNDKPLAED